MLANTGKKKLTLSIVLILFLLIFSTIASGVEREECCLYMEKPDCPSRYTSFNPSQDTYSPGETVEIVLSGLNDHYKMERIEIEEVGASREVVYTEELNQDVSKDASQWKWSWDQIGNSGKRVGTDHYFALLETQCCGIYRTDFRIQRQVRVRPVCGCSCCGGLFSGMDLDTGSRRYKSGEDVSFVFSNCGDCSIVFESLSIKRISSTCCGSSEVVFSREFQDGFEPGQDWSWSWDQRGNQDDLVEPGRYAMTIETKCCSALRTVFTVYETRDCQCRSCNTCGFGLLSLFSCGSNDCCN